MKVAILGLGHMGQAMAGRLLGAGHDVTMWNRTPGKAPELLDRGASEADTVAEAVSDVEVAITTLANDDAVKEVALGEGGIGEALSPDATYVDSSTVAPVTSEELEAGFARFVAMPILGSPQQAASGEAIFLIGSSNGSARAIEPLFPALSEKRIAYDRPALAAGAKLTVNLLLLNGVVALAEAFADGRAAGLSDDQLRELLGSSPMVAPGLRYRFEGVLTGDQEPLWTTTLGAKDARLAIELAASAHVDLPLTSKAHSLYEKVASISPKEDIVAVSNLYRRPEL